MRNITLIHPSRGRAELASKTMHKWLSKAKKPHLLSYWLSIEADQLPDYRKHFDGESMLIGVNSNAVEAINNAAKSLTFDIVVVISDDFDCPLHWDETLLNVIGNRTNFVLKTFDTTQHWIVTLPIMDWEYYKQFNYIYYPEFKHMFCDTWLTHVADLEGRLIVRNDIVFPHFTHVTGNDAINAKNNATWDQGEKLYLDLVRTNYPNNFKLNQHAKGHIAWLKAKL